MSTGFMQSNTLFYLKDILSSTATVGSTFRISGDIELGGSIETGGLDAFMVFKNGTQIERLLVTATGGVATIVKRGLQQDGVTENSSLRKSWNDGSIGFITVRPDDFIATDKLDTAGGLRTNMGTAQNIGAINASTAITVADTSGWTNGASITGTGIPNGTTIVSFVANTSAVLSANYTGVTGTVSVIIGRMQVTEINTSNNEVKRVVGSGTTIQSTETIRKRKADGSYEEVPYLNIKNDIASLVLPSVQETQFESILVAGDIVGQLPDGIYKTQTEIKTSTALGGANTYLDHCQVSTGKYLILYAVGGNMTAVVASISSSDVVTYGTPLNLGGAVTPTGKLALINTNKVVAVFSAIASATATSVILTVSGTSVSAGTLLNETMAAASSQIRAVFKVRTDCYCYANGLNSNTSTLRVNTVSGTTCTTGTTIASYAFGFSGVQIYGCYLSDNIIGTVEGNTVSGTANVNVFQITSGSTTVATTYTGSMSVTVNNSLYVARYSDTEMIMTNFINTEKSIFTIPGAGTVLVKTTLTATGATNYPVTSLFTNIYAINTGSTILIYQRDILIGTIASTPAYNSQGIHYDNGRILFFNGATLIPTLVNLARIFAIGVAFNASGLFTTGKTKASKTGIIKGYRYYIQPDGTISNGIGITSTVSMTQFYGRGLLTDIIMTEL